MMSGRSFALIDWMLFRYVFSALGSAVALIAEKLLLYSLAGTASGSQLG